VNLKAAQLAVRSFSRVDVLNSNIEGRPLPALSLSIGVRGGV